MAYKIADGCVKCGYCELECPNQAISAGETTYIINADRCADCVGVYESPKSAEICLVNAPTPNPAHRETQEQLLDKWGSLHPNEVTKVT